MESISEDVIEKKQQASPEKRNICPALVFADTIVCGALGRFYQPSSRQIRECCANEYHVHCPLRRTA